MAKNLKNVRTGKNVSKIPKSAKVEAPGIREKVDTTIWIFGKFGEYLGKMLQGLVLQRFPYQS